MITKVHDLFEENNGGDLPEQAKCRELLKQWGIDGYTLYKDALELTMEDMARPHKYPTKNIFATTFNSYVIGLASERYPNWIRVTDDKRVDRVYLEPQANWHIYLKQLYGEQAKPANIPTGYVRMLNASELFADDETPIMALYMGAIMDEEKKSVMNQVRVSRVNTKNSRAEWSIDMFEFVQTNTASLPKSDTDSKASENDKMVKGKKQNGDSKTGTGDSKGEK